MQASKESLEPVFSVLINAVGLCRQCLSSWEYQGLYAKWDSFSEKSIPQQPHSKDNWQHMEIQVQASPPYQRLEPTANILAESPAISEWLIAPV